MSYLIPDNDTSIVKMAGIDVCDESLLEAVDRCTPWQTDYEQLRNNPLVIDIYKGLHLNNQNRIKTLFFFFFFFFT